MHRVTVLLGHVLRASLAEAFRVQGGFKSFEYTPYTGLRYEGLIQSRRPGWALIGPTPMNHFFRRPSGAQEIGTSREGLLG